MLVRHEKGDTLIEVLFAVTVFSLVIVGSLSLMNQGLAASQRALEITQVREQIDGQAETLRFMHDSYVAVYEPGMDATKLSGAAREWYRMLGTSGAVVTTASAFGVGNEVTCSAPPAKSFIVDPTTAHYVPGPSIFAPTDTIAKLTYNTPSNSFNQSKGIWVEAVRSPNSSDPTQQNSGYIDFHIRACWDAPGLSRPMNIGTIVRLYEPRG